MKTEGEVYGEERGADRVGAGAQGKGMNDGEA